MLNPRSSREECRSQGATPGSTSARQSINQPAPLGSQGATPGSTSSRQSTNQPAPLAHPTDSESPPASSSCSKSQPPQQTDPSVPAVLARQPQTDQTASSNHTGLLSVNDPPSPTDDSHYEETSYRSTATIRLTQPLVLPPYKRDRLPDGETTAAAAADDPTAEEDLTYERLGRQFLDLTAKVSIQTDVHLYER